MQNLQPALLEASLGCVLKSNNVNHTNCFDCIWNEVEKMSGMKSFVANM